MAYAHIKGDSPLLWSYDDTKQLDPGNCSASIQRCLGIRS